MGTTLGDLGKEGNTDETKLVLMERITSTKPSQYVGSRRDFQKFIRGNTNMFSEGYLKNLRNGLCANPILEQRK
jgi:hypothetical protein